MNSVILNLAAAAATAILPAMATAEGVPLSLMVADTSGSSTFLYDQSSAEAAGRWVETYVAGLEAPHALRMVSMGDPALARRVIDIEARIGTTRATGAKRMAAEFGGYFRSLPQLVASGQIADQGSTSILAFFRSLEAVCARGNVTVVVFTDGLEWSTEIDGRALVAGTMNLPAPDRAHLAGCSVIMMGVGHVRGTMASDGLEARLVPAWRAYLDTAGAAPVVVMGSGFTF